MSQSRMRRWFAAGITGALFTVVSLVSAGSVAADGQPYVQPVGYNDPQSNIVVVAPPGTINAGVAYNPITNTGPATNAQTVINGQPYNVWGGYAYPVAYGQPYYQWNPAAGTYVIYNGSVPNPAYYGYGYGGYGYGGYGYGGYGYSGCGYGCTAAGPIVGVQPNGVAVVADVQSGNADDYYVVDPVTGKFVPSDVNGNTNLDVKTRP
jgi:hypothetical protein